MDSFSLLTSSLLSTVPLSSPIALSVPQLRAGFPAFLHDEELDDFEEEDSDTDAEEDLGSDIQLRDIRIPHPNP